MLWVSAKLSQRAPNHTKKYHYNCGELLKTLASSISKTAPQPTARCMMPINHPRSYADGDFIFNTLHYLVVRFRNNDKHHAAICS